MRYVYIMLTALFFMLLWMFLFMGDTYYAGMSAIATAITGFLVTTYNRV